MKTNSRAVEKLRSREAEPGSQAVGSRRFVTLRLSTLDFSTRILTNDPGMSMKTKEGCGKLRCGTIVLSQSCLISRSPDHPITGSRIALGTMAHLPKSQVFQMPHCRFLRRARRQFVQRLRGLIYLGGCEMSLKARAGCCGSALRLRADEAGSSPESVKGDRLARELQFIFGYWKPQV